MDEHEVFKEAMARAVSMEMEAGDVLLFNATLFHSVGINYTNTQRRSVALGYRAVDELDPTPNLDTQMLVAGEWSYRGHAHPVSTR